MRNSFLKNWFKRARVHKFGTTCDEPAIQSASLAESNTRWSTLRHYCWQLFTQKCSVASSWSPFVIDCTWSTAIASIRKNLYNKVHLVTWRSDHQWSLASFLSHIWGTSWLPLQIKAQISLRLSTSPLECSWRRLQYTPTLAAAQSRLDSKWFHQKKGLLFTKALMFVKLHLDVNTGWRRYGAGFGLNALNGLTQVSSKLQTARDHPVSLLSAACWVRLYRRSHRI